MHEYISNSATGSGPPRVIAGQARFPDLRFETLLVRDFDKANSCVGDGGVEARESTP
jgi:hypothetical protein